jgi:hypothetical protein
MTSGVSTPTSMVSSLTKTPAMMPAVGEKGAPSKFRENHEELKQFLQHYKNLTSIYNCINTQKYE